MFQTDAAAPTEDQRQKLLECLSAGKAPCTYVKVSAVCAVKSVRRRFGSVCSLFEM